MRPKPRPSLLAVDAPRVVLAYDRTDGADIALDAIARLPWPIETRIRIVGIRDAHLRFLRPLADALLLAELEEDVALAARRLRSELPAGIAVEEHAFRGHAVTGIVAEADRLAADLVVVGSRNRGPTRSTLFGSVGREIVAGGERPVLIARRQSIDRVLLAHDGSDASRRAVRMLGSWPIFAAASVKMFSVADVASADATSQILTTAALEETDLIVLGAAAAHGLDRLVHGALASDLLPRTSCSLLVVPATAPVSLEPARLLSR